MGFRCCFPTTDALPESRRGRPPPPLSGCSMSERRSNKFSLRYLLRPTVDDHPARPALHGTVVWTYQHLEADARRLARRWLAGGLEPGDRVALLLPNRPEAMLAYLACFKSG